MQGRLITMLFLKNYIEKPKHCAQKNVNRNGSLSWSQTSQQRLLNNYGPKSSILKKLDEKESTFSIRKISSLNSNIVKDFANPARRSILARTFANNKSNTDTNDYSSNCSNRKNITETTKETENNENSDLVVSNAEDVIKEFNIFEVKRLIKSLLLAMDMRPKENTDIGIDKRSKEYEENIYRFYNKEENEIVKNDISVILQNIKTCIIKIDREESEELYFAENGIFLNFKRLNFYFEQNKYLQETINSAVELIKVDEKMQNSHLIKDIIHLWNLMKMVNFLVRGEVFIMNYCVQCSRISSIDLIELKYIKSKIIIELTTKLLLDLENLGTDIQNAILLLSKFENIYKNEYVSRFYEINQMIVHRRIHKLQVFLD